MSDKFDLPRFAVDVESAFALIGGEKSKATYDWMIATQERVRIIKLLEEVQLSNPKSFIDVRMFETTRKWIIALIKGEAE